MNYFNILIDYKFQNIILNRLDFVRSIKFRKSDGSKRMSARPDKSNAYSTRLLWLGRFWKNSRFYKYLKKLVFILLSSSLFNRFFNLPVSPVFDDGVWFEGSAPHGGERVRSVGFGNHIFEVDLIKILLFDIFMNTFIK